jgi:hypothetical protein
LNEKLQLLVYADDVHVLGDSIHTVKDDKDILLEARRNFGLKINSELAEYMIMFLHSNSGENQNIRIANKSFENVPNFKYLGTTLRIRKAFMMKSRLD